MNRRGFLSLLGGAVVAAAAPTKAYSFLGGILRPRKPEFYMNKRTYEMLERQVNPPIVGHEVYRDKFVWKFMLGRPIYRMTDLKVETNEKGQVISWAPTEKTKFIWAPDDPLEPMRRLNGEA